MSRISLDPNVPGAGPRPAMSNLDGTRTKDTAPFAQQLERERRAASHGVDLYGDLKRIEVQVGRGKRLTPEELLTYQMKIGKFGLEIELLSKVAEGGVATVRKLSNG